MAERFQKLKRDNVITIFNTALDKVRTTRTDLSVSTGLSFVTVSKICDELLSLDILKQSFTTDKSATRRSRIISVKHKFWIGVYVFEPDLFTFNICDLSLRCIHTFNYIPTKDIFLDDCIKRFIRFAEKFAQQKMRNCICCGTGILVPGEYDKVRDTVPTSPIPHFNSINIIKTFTDKIFDTDPVVSSLHSAYLREAQTDLSENDRLLTLFLNKSDLKSSYVDKHSKESFAINNLGILSAASDRNISLEKLCKTPPQPDELFPRLADIIFTLMNTVKVTKITLSGNLYSRMDAAAYVLNKHLSTICNEHCIIPPEISNINIREIAMKNIAREIRNRWFVCHILQEDSL